jgi:hypothetical protein
MTMKEWTQQELADGLMELHLAIRDHLEKHQDQDYVGGQALERRVSQFWEALQAVRGRIAVLEGRLDALPRVVGELLPNLLRMELKNIAGGGSPSGAGRPGPVPPPGVSNPKETP